MKKKLFTGLIFVCIINLSYLKADDEPVYGASEKNNWDVIYFDCPWTTKRADNVYGLNFGFFVAGKTNYVHGMQFGLVNVIEDGWLPFMPLINFSF